MEPFVQLVHHFWWLLLRLLICCRFLIIYWGTCAAWLNFTYSFEIRMLPLSILFNWTNWSSIAWFFVIFASFITCPMKHLIWKVTNDRNLPKNGYFDYKIFFNSSLLLNCIKMALKSLLTRGHGFLKCLFLPQMVLARDLNVSWIHCNI